jgi:large subunit ribosomal protein L24
MAKIKKGDLVVVIAGSRKDRGKQGRVLQVLKDRDRVVVEGIHRVTKHTKAGVSSRGTRTGGIETIEAPIHISNVMLVDPETKKGTRIGYRLEQVERDGRMKTMKVRVAKRSGKDV